LIPSLKQSEVRLVTGSQNLYGAETLRQVAQNANCVAATLDKSRRIPCREGGGRGDEGEQGSKGMAHGEVLFFISLSRSCGVRCLGAAAAGSSGGGGSMASWPLAWATSTTAGGVTSSSLASEVGKAR